MIAFVKHTIFFHRLHFFTPIHYPNKNVWQLSMAQNNTIDQVVVQCSMKL